MAAYPSYPQLLGSIRKPVDDLTVDRAVDGSAKSRAFYTARKFEFTLKHQLNASDLAGLLSFYDTNRKLSVTLTWQGDSSTASCLFRGAPDIRPLDRGWSDVTVELAEQ